MPDKEQQFKNVINNMLKGLNSKTIGDNIYFDNIPPKKLANAIISLEIPEKEKVLILFDNTVFGSAKNGMAITPWGIRYKDIINKWAISWEQLFRKDFVYHITDEIPGISPGNKESGDYPFNIIFSISTIDTIRLSCIIQAGVYIFGDQNETNINSVADLGKLAVPKKPNSDIDNISDTYEDEEGEDDDEGESDDFLENMSKGDKEYIDQRAELISIHSDIHESMPVDIKVQNIEKKLVLVCGPDDSDYTIAENLSNLIKQSPSAETELKSSKEYEAANFENELLGQESDDYAILIGAAASAAVLDMAWKYNERGIKYGWKGKKAALLVERRRYTAEENTKNGYLLSRYDASTVQEALAKKFYNEGILLFLEETS